MFEQVKTYSDNLHFERCRDCKAFLTDQTGINVCADCRVSICNACILAHVERDASERARREHDRAMCKGSTAPMFADLPAVTRRRRPKIRPQRVSDDGMIFAPQPGYLNL